MFYYGGWLNIVCINIKSFIFYCIRYFKERLSSLHSFNFLSCKILTFVWREDVRRPMTLQYDGSDPTNQVDFLSIDHHRACRLNRFMSTVNPWTLWMSMNENGSWSSSTYWTCWFPVPPLCVRHLSEVNKLFGTCRKSFGKSENGFNSPCLNSDTNNRAATHSHLVFRGLIGVQIHLKEVINTYKNTFSIRLRNKHLNDFC